MKANISSEEISDTSTHLNQSSAGPIIHNHTNLQAIAELVPIALIIIVVNMLVFVLFCKTKKLRTQSNYILVSLAISDFMTGALDIPLFVIVFFTPTISSRKVRFYLGFLVVALHTITAALSVYHIFLATLEKYLSIICPVTHRLVKKATVKKALLMVWFVSAVIGFLPFAWIDKPSGDVHFFVHGILCLVMVFILPYSFMIYAFVKVFRVVSRRAKQRNKRRKRRLAQERKCVMLFVSMATLFAICWFPWFIIMLLLILKLIQQAHETPSHIFALVRYLTSIINPFLYSLLRPDFYAALKHLLKKLKSYIALQALSVTANFSSWHQRKSSRHALNEIPHDTP